MLKVAKPGNWASLTVCDRMHVAVESLLLMLHAMSASFPAYLAMLCVTCGISFVVPDQTQGVVASLWTHPADKL